MCLAHEGLIQRVDHVLWSTVAKLAAGELDQAQPCPHSYNRWLWPKAAIWGWDLLGEATSEAKRQSRPDLREREHYGYHHYTLNRCPVPVQSWPGQYLPGPVPQHHPYPHAVGGHVYGQQCAQGATMKQTLKNCMASLVGDLMQAASTEVMLDMRHVVPAKWCKHQAGPVLSHGGKQSPIGTSLSDE